MKISLCVAIALNLVTFCNEAKSAQTNKRRRRGMKPSKRVKYLRGPVVRGGKKALCFVFVKK